MGEETPPNNYDPDLVTLNYDTLPCLVTLASMTLIFEHIFWSLAENWDFTILSLVTLTHDLDLQSRLRYDGP